MVSLPLLLDEEEPEEENKHENVSFVLLIF